MRLLTGVKVLDVGRYVAGPYCATLLGGFGAKVTRVERPEGGEDRFISPLSYDEQGQPREGGLFYQTACGKKSAALNFKTRGGREALRRLAAASDVVVANWPPKSLALLGLDWPTLSRANPRVILATQTAFGAHGPDADKGGFDGVAQAMSGAMHLTGSPGAPAKAAAPYVDFCTAVLSALGVMAALMAREKTGRGEHVEASLLHTALAVMNAHLIEQAVTKRDRVGTGNRVQTSAPSDVFATTDGHILVHTVGDAIFARWARLVDRDDLIDDPRYQGDQARGDRRDELCAIMRDWCAPRSTARALEAMEAAGVPSGPVFDFDEALSNPQAAAMAIFRLVEDEALARPAPVVDAPLRFSALQAGLAGAPPRLGEHTDAVLRAVGYDDAGLDALRAEGAIPAADSHKKQT